jgi:hypothetical protein
MTNVPDAYICLNPLNEEDLPHITLITYNKLDYIKLGSHSFGNSTFDRMDGLMSIVTTNENYTSLHIDTYRNYAFKMVIDNYSVYFCAKLIMARFDVDKIVLKVDVSSKVLFQQ